MIGVATVLGPITVGVPAGMDVSELDFPLSFCPIPPILNTIPAEILAIIKTLPSSATIILNRFGLPGWPLPPKARRISVTLA